MTRERLELAFLVLVVVSLAFVFGGWGWALGIFGVIALALVGLGWYIRSMK